MPTWYMWIKPLQEPFDSGLDDLGRSSFTFNVLCRKIDSATFEEELISLLEAGTVGVAAETIFVGAQSKIPDPLPVDDDADQPAILSVVNSGGMAPLRVQEEVLPKYRQPTAQIVARHKDYKVARELARAAYAVLAAVKNQDVTP